MTMMAKSNQEPDEITALRKTLADLRDRLRASDEHQDYALAQTAERMRKDLNLRGKVLNPSGHLFGDPAMSIMLYVFEMSCRHRFVGTSEAGAASSAPETTALRYVTALANAGLLHRAPDRFDRRRTRVLLTPRGREMMIDYLNKSEWV